MSSAEIASVVTLSFSSAPVSLVFQDTHHVELPIRVLPNVLTILYTNKMQSQLGTNKGPVHPVTIMILLQTSQLKIKSMKECDG